MLRIYLFGTTRTLARFLHYIIQSLKFSTRSDPCLHRKRIETVGSLLHRLMSKQIHAVISKGFELKLFLFVFAYIISSLYHTTTSSGQ